MSVRRTFARFAAIAGLVLSIANARADQTISPLSPADQARLADQRQVVERRLAPSSLNGNYRTAPGKLGALQAILAAKAFKPTQTYELQSMGIVLGDAFVQDMGFHWVMVTDESGRDPALRYRESSVLLYPLTMISKRVERGESVDVFGLYNGVAGQAARLIDEAARAKR